MRFGFVHCPTTLATLVLPMLGVFIAVFPLAHISCSIVIRRASFAVSIHPLALAGP